MKITEAEDVPCAEGRMCGAAMQGADAPSWSKTPSCTKGAGRKLGDLTSPAAVRRLRVASGSRGDEAGEKVAERNSYDECWRADVAEKLAGSARKLSDAREQLSEAQ